MLSFSDLGTERALGRWAGGTNKFTGFTTGGAAVAMGLSIAAGVGIAWLAGTVVLDVNNRSLGGKN